jgi:CheY-like chemotaxis protein
VLVSANLPGAADLPQRAGHQVPMILLSPGSRRPSGVEVNTLGFAASLAKPLRMARLAEAAARALNSAGQAEDDTTRFQHGARALGRVLVVEDDAINQQLAVAVLVREGWTADVVGNGHEALEALGRARYDAVLMDLLMPVMDGFEAAAAIRSWEKDRKLPRVPIIAVSAIDDPDARARSLAAGMDDHLRKPFDPKALRRLLRRWLKGGAASAAG